MDYKKFQVSIVAILLVLQLAYQVSSNDIKTLYTNGDSYNQYFTLEENMAAEKTLRFSVRAPSDVHILLATTHKVDQPVYEIVLGAHDNTVNYIRGRCPCQEEPSAMIRTFNVLSQNELRNFWIRLKPNGRKTFIQVGIGGEAHPFLEWLDRNPLEPEYFSFKSRSAAEWRYGYADKNYTNGVSTDTHKSVVLSNGFGQYFPLSEVVSHSDKAVTLYFSIRMSEQFQILLTPGLSSSGEVYEISLHEKGATLRRLHSGEPVVNFTQNGFLNKQKLFEFWIKLTNDGQIMLGKRENLAEPILQWKDPNPLSPQFVSFSIYRSRPGKRYINTISHLQYGLGPDYTLTSQDCTPRWKDYLTPGAVRGGHYNNEGQVYVCRGLHVNKIVSPDRTLVLPGSFVPGENHTAGLCQFTFDLFVHQSTAFQVLTGCGISWVPASLGAIPEGAIPSGDPEIDSLLYATRVSYEGQLIIGELTPGDRLTYIAFNNQRLPFTHYEVLVDRRKSKTPFRNG